MMHVRSVSCSCEIRCCSTFKVLSAKKSYSLTTGKDRSNDHGTVHVLRSLDGWDITRTDDDCHEPSSCTCIIIWNVRPANNKYYRFAMLHRVFMASFFSAQVWLFLPTRQLECFQMQCAPIDSCLNHRCKNVFTLFNLFYFWKRFC